MGKLWGFSLLLLFALAAVPPKLDLDFPCALFCFTHGVMVRINVLLGLPSVATFDASEPSAGLSKLQTLRASLTRSLKLLPAMYEAGLPIVRIERSIEGVRCLTYRPVGVKGPLPTLVYFHGGGYVVGSPEWWDNAMIEIAHDLKIAVINVDYPLAPEYKFPEPVRASVRVVNWIMSEQGTAHGFDGSRVMMAGDSAGGGMAAAVASVIINTSPEKARNIIANVLMYPFLDLTQSHTSNVLFAEGYFLTAQHLLWYGQLYVRNQSDYLDPIASPLLAADSTLQGMAPTLVLTAEMDPLRDEGEEYASRLSGVGVPTKMIRFDATVHAYMFLPCQAQKSSVQELKAWLSTYAFGHHTMREQPFHATEAASSAVSSEL